MLFNLVLKNDQCLKESTPCSRSTLPDVLHLYRAAAQGYELGLSWTSDFSRAHWYATRLGTAAGGQHRIYEIDAPRTLVLAEFHKRRREHEYLLDLDQDNPPELREIDPKDWNSLQDISNVT